MSSNPTPATKEIHAYLAARDLALATAEQHPNEETLQRASAANDFAANCLKPARMPYQAQSLPEAEAAPERQRCQAVRVRLAQLRIRVAAPQREALVAA